MGKAELDRNRWLFRIYRWPVSYFVGLVTGLTVAFGFAFFSSSIWQQFDEVGVYLLLGGGCLIMAGSFGKGMERFLDLPPRGKGENFVRKLSIVIGGTLFVIAWAFFVTSAELEKEQISAGNPIPLRVD